MSERWGTAWRRLPHPFRWLMVAGIGGTLVGLGLLFMVLPGPGIPMVILGLIILATEFAWAERLLHRVRKGAGRAAEKARSAAGRRAR